MEQTVRIAAERAAAEVHRIVHEAALEACRSAVQEALSELVGGVVAGPDDATIEDRVIRTEAARRLGITQQRIIRLEKKGLVHSEREDGRVYVRLSEVEYAIRSH